MPNIPRYHHLAMSRGAACISIVTVMALLLATLTAGGAGDERGTEMLQVGEHLAVRIDNEDGGDIEVRYFVAVVNEGPTIDVFFMDDEAYDLYESGGEGNYYLDYSVLNVRDVDKTFVWDEKGVFYVVVDNTMSGTPPPADPEAQNATIAYVVTWDPVDQGDWLRSTFVALIVLFVAIFAAVLAVTVLRRPR